jgi:ferredoxin
MAEVATEVADIEDFGAIAINEYKCCGAMTCRVLAPEIFVETPRHSDAKVCGAVRTQSPDRREAAAVMGTSFS